jgi:ATP-dependent Clp protease ATP-binding subunit ClpA
MASTLNPNLINEDTGQLLNAAAELMDRYRKRNIFPEMLLMALIDNKDSAGYKLLQRFAASNNVDLARLSRQARLAVESRRDLPGDLSFITTSNKQVPLSRQMIIALDEALTIAEKVNEVYVGSNHLLAAMAQQRLGTGGILRQYGITPQALTSMIGGRQRRDQPTGRQHLHSGPPDGRYRGRLCGAGQSRENAVRSTSARTCCAT